MVRLCLCVLVRLLIDTRAGGIWNERVEMIVFLIDHTQRTHKRVDVRVCACVENN